MAVESRFVPDIAACLHYRVTTVKHTLRALREDGLIPGKRVGDIHAKHIVDVIFGLTAPTLPRVACTTRTLRAMSAVDDTAGLPCLASNALEAIIAVLPKSPVLGDLDLDDGFISIADDRIQIEALSLTGKRAVIRYGAGITTPLTSPMHRFELNDVRVLAKIIGNRHENRKTGVRRAA